MSFDRLKRTQRRKRLPGHKLKPSRATLFVQNSKPHLSMKPTYFLGVDAAYAKFCSRSHRAVIRVFNEEGNVTEIHKQYGRFQRVMERLLNDSNWRTTWIADAHRDNGKRLRCAGG